MQFFTIVFLFWAAAFSYHCPHAHEQGHQHSVACLTNHLFSSKNSIVLLRTVNTFCLAAAAVVGVILFYFTHSINSTRVSYSYHSRAPPVILN